MRHVMGPLGVPRIKPTHGLTMEHRDASTSSPIIDRIADVNQTPYYVDESDDPTIGFLLDCVERGGKKRPPSIRKVPRILRDHRPGSFRPQLVSIGPIHREDPKLKQFEWLKKCYLNDLLHRCDSTPKKTLEACMLKVKTLIPEIRESYAGIIKNYSDSELARMMVMDGCFILEFCFKHEEKNSYLPNKMQNTRIAMDLMLLENQVPFFVLQALFECSMGKQSYFTLTGVLDTYLAPYIKVFCSNLFPQKNSSNVLSKYLAPCFKLFCSLLPEKFSTTNVDSDLPENFSTTNVDSDLPKTIAIDVYSDSTPDHVLGYMHKRYRLVGAKSSKPIDEEQLENTYTAFHSIVELDRSGVNFKPQQEYSGSMTVNFQPSLFPCLPQFCSPPTLLMPSLVIDDSTELILRNFIAYEQSLPQDRYYFTSYAHAMDMLIDTQEDIAKLVESKVLVNRLGSNKEAANMINKICRNTFVTDGDAYIQAFEQLDKYYNGLLPTYIAWMKRTYHNNPFYFIALVAATILFFLTVVQTYYTIKGK